MKTRSLLETTLAVSSLGLSTLFLVLAPLADAGEPLVLGERLQLRSQSMGEMRTYQVHRPAGYDLSNARYPVLVVLDGNEHFEHVSATADFLASAAKVPAMIVVGIPNTDRFRDLSSYRTPPGASPLLEFITAELLPKIDRDYRTRPYRILMGWSSAGFRRRLCEIAGREIVVAPARPRGQYPEAEQVIGRAIELYPENTTALYYAGRLRMETRNTAAAIEILKKSLLLSPNDRLARSLLNDMKIDPNGVVAEVRLSAKDLAKYVGGYGDSTVVLVIERRGDKIFGKTVDREYELDALSATKFHYSENNVYSDGGVITFRTDDRGRVTGLVFQKDGAELAKLK